MLICYCIFIIVELSHMKVPLYVNWSILEKYNFNKISEGIPLSSYTNIIYGVNVHLIIAN